DLRQPARRRRGGQQGLLHRPRLHAQPRVLRRLHGLRRGVRHHRRDGPAAGPVRRLRRRPRRRPGGRHHLDHLPHGGEPGRGRRAGGTGAAARRAPLAGQDGRRTDVRAQLHRPRRPRLGGPAHGPGRL
ncbi:MAG: Glyoxalase family protein, partial [uncultured Friedmanniella sp.]